MISRLMLWLAGGAGAFALGVWSGPWLRSKVFGTPGTAPARPAAQRAGPPLPPGAASASSIVLDPGQARVDARLAAESPQAFLDSLRGESGLKAQARIAAAIAELPLAAVQELAQVVDAQGFGNNGPQGWQFTWAVFERWSELDANGLLQAARLAPNRQIGYVGTNAAFVQLARRDPAGAWAKAQDAGGLTFYAKAAVLQALGESQPAEALRLAQQDASTRQNGWAAGGIMQTWFMRDRQAALGALEGVPAGDFRTTLVNSLSSAFASSDPEAALAWGRQLKNPAERQQALREVIDVMASRDPLGTLQRLDTPELALNRRQGMATAVDAWAKRDFPAALDYVLASKSPADQQEMLSTLSRGATQSERARLLEVAGSLPPSSSKSIYEAALFGSFYGTSLKPSEVLDQVKSLSVREDLIKSVLQNSWSMPVEDQQALFAKLQPTSQTKEQAGNVAQRLAASDPAAAVKWAEGLGSADLQSAARKTALQAWSASDPQAAAARAMTVTDPSERFEILRGIAGNWSRQDDQAALTWARSLPAADQSAAFGALVQNSLQASPQQAQELYSAFATSLDATNSAKPENTAIARSMAATLTENDPRQAITWAQSLAPGGAQDQALAGIAEKWAAHDPAATSEWLGSLPGGEGRDLAAEKLVAAIARDDPDSAWVWATSIGTAAQRRDAAARVLEAWKGYGKTSEARAALDAAGFPPDVALELAKKLD